MSRLALSGKALLGVISSCSERANRFSIYLPFYSPDMSESSISSTSGKTKSDVY